MEFETTKTIEFAYTTDEQGRRYEATIVIEPAEGHTPFTVAVDTWDGHRIGISRVARHATGARAEALKIATSIVNGHTEGRE